MEIIRAIVEKLKIKDIFAILFISGICFSIFPESIADKLKILELRNKYQSLVSVGLLLIGAYYILSVLRKIIWIILKKMYSSKRKAIKYMKGPMSLDEKRLLIETFYDIYNNIFNATGYIEINDGRKAALEYHGIIYRSANVSYYTSFAYNLQPYVLEYLNQNLLLGNIDIQGNLDEYTFIFNLH